jgi:hypothetical protein
MKTIMPNSSMSDLLRSKAAGPGHNFVDAVEVDVEEVEAPADFTGRIGE